MFKGNDLMQRARLTSGCILFVFVTTHLLNTALGNISLEAMEAGRRVFVAVWRNPVGTTVLIGAFATHLSLVLFSLFRRRRLKMPWVEALQIIAGLAIPFVVMIHILGTRGIHELYGINDTYAFVVLSLWVWDWEQGLLQVLAVLLAWTHGCLGLYFWLRLKPWFATVQGAAFVIALLLPTISIAGFASAGKEAAILAQNSLWLQARMAEVGLPDGAADWVYDMADLLRMSALGVLVAIFAARWLRVSLEGRNNRFNVTYPDGARVTCDRGLSVLEASRIGGQSHASVCGGRGRCSTCRVRIVAGRGGLPLPSEAEQRVLDRVGAPDNVRLACQLRPAGDVTVIPLLPANAEPRAGFRRPGYLQGSEREIAVLFSDLRSFTQFSESKLPYDVVFVLNQYFRTMGGAIEDAGGRLDKFIGDGTMALFGIDSGPEAGCRQALNAARAMAQGLEELNRQLANDLSEPLRMGIGIHAGPAIVGEMGFHHATSVTAIGDTVNTASRLESMTKELACGLIVSESVIAYAGIEFADHPRKQIQVRGRTEPMEIAAIADPARLAELEAGAPSNRTAGEASPVADAAVGES
ncbi:MAG: adenylate/guanylate cyclase domain-containing protein [Alphaproteobacteria bacterium]